MNLEQFIEKTYKYDTYTTNEFFIINHNLIYDIRT